MVGVKKTKAKFMGVVRSWILNGLKKGEHEDMGMVVYIIRVAW